MRLKISYRDAGLACLSAGLLLLSFPKFDLSILAWVGLVPLLVALEGKSLRRAFFLAYLAGLIAFLGISYWLWAVPDYRVIDGILLCLYLPQYVSVWGLTLNWIRKRTGASLALAAPPLWVTLEYIRSHLSFLSLPWALMGHSQYSHPTLIQISSITGVYGLTYLIVLVNAAIAEVMISLRRGPPEPLSPLLVARWFPASLIIAGVLLAATSFYGLSVLSRGIDGRRITIAAIQGNIPQDTKWNASYQQLILDRYAGLTHQAAQQRPALIVWPETAVPGDVRHRPELQRKVAEVAIEAKTHLLVGSSEYAKFSDRRFEGRYYNSMFLFEPDGKIAGQYRKIALLPFGEYEPLNNVFHWPKAIVSSVGKFLPGNEYTVFRVGDTSFGAVICWEIIFPDLFREFVKRGARFIVNGTNDAWFYEAFPYQLLAMSTFRAVENRVPVVRAANTGITAFIDPFGRIEPRLRGPGQKELFVEGFLVGTIALSDERTFYTRFGDLFAFLQIAACAVLLLYSCLRPVTKARMTP